MLQSALPLSLLVRWGLGLLPQHNRKGVQTHPRQAWWAPRTVLLRQSTSCGGKCPVSLCSRASFAWIHHSLPSPSLLPTFFSSYHSRSPDLTALSRHDLEDNLLNSLVILEVLSRQLRDWKSQQSGPHPKVQDSSTQTDTFPNEVRYSS